MNPPFHSKLFVPILFFLINGTAIPDGGKGLAGKYLGDGGIENDPMVVFVEKFQEGDLNIMKTRWEDVKAEKTMTISLEKPLGSADPYSLLMTHVGEEGTGGYLYRRLLPGYDQLYLRFYVRFDPDCFDIHHFVHMGGYYPPTPWPQGGAGTKPSGDDRLTTGVEPFGNAWRWDFYSYWMEMHGSPGGFWGNDFINDAALTVAKGKWICVELMMKMNDPVIAWNGEQAMWIDGKLWSKNGQIVSHLGRGFPNGNWVWDSFFPDPQGTPFEGFKWRKTTQLDLNFVWILQYITKAPKGYISKVWFDNIVVAKEYIGPLNTDILWADASTIPAATGGSLNLTLAAGKSEAFRNYLILGGLSGVSPGTPLPGGLVTLPLNWDAFTNLVIEMTNSPALASFHGTLGSGGEAFAKLDTLGPLPPNSVGLVMNFAYLLYYPFDFVSNPIEITIVL